jgi:hypothetical protein
MTLPAAEDMIGRYARTGVAVDTPLLLLLAVGNYERAYIPGFKRTKDFSGEDYDIVSSFLAKFPRLMISPHVFSEVSNYSFQIPQGRLDSYLTRFLQLISLTKEIYVPKDAVIAHHRFRSLGATDTALIMSCAEGSYLLLSTDRRLCGMARNEGVEALHFDELRGYVWFSGS